MIRSSRGFKILNAVNSNKKEKENAQINDNKKLNSSTQTKQNVTILSNISLNVHNNQKALVEVHSSENDQKTNASDENYELSLAIQNLKGDCNKTQEILKSDETENHIDTIEDVYASDCNVQDIHVEPLNLEFETYVVHEEADFNTSYNLLAFAAGEEVVGPILDTELDVQDTSIPREKELNDYDTNTNLTTETEGIYQQDEEQDDSEKEWVGSDRDSTDEDNIILHEEREARRDTNSTDDANDKTQNEEGERKRKRRKSRLSDSKQWEYNRYKKKREEGLAYLGRKGEKFIVEKGKRELKQRCACKTEKAKNIQCSKVSEEERKGIFKKFWRLTWNEKIIYVNSRIIKKNTKRARHRKNETDTRRTCSLEYFMDFKHAKIRVCKTMFCHTLGMSVRTISKWITDSKEDVIHQNQETVTKTTNSRCSQKSVLNERNVKRNQKREDIGNFLHEIPKLESHYCRKSTTKLYLEPLFKTKVELYLFYKNNWCKERELNPASLTLFMYVFEEMNLALFAPKKDECDLCVGYRTKNVNETDYNEHLLKKEEARNEKEKDKTSSNRVFTMDMQSVLLCPKSNVSSLYYRTKLIVHNFTIYDIQSKAGYCFLWHEGEGELKANCFASIICYFLLNEVLPSIDKEKNPTIILYSDGCGAQNRNVTLSNALLNFSIENGISIIQKYLEKGHTQMECDSMHSTIERKLKGRIINVPADYVYLAKTARKNPEPYQVKYLQHDFFKSFAQVNFFKSIRPGFRVGDPTVQDIRALKYNSNGTIQFKTRHYDVFQTLPARQNKQAKMIPAAALPNLYQNSIKIKKEKYDNLQFLKRTMEKDYHNFYDNLSHE